MRTHRTYRKLIGQDIYGKHVERRIYSDDEYREYVALGKYAWDDPKALVPIDYFIEHLVSSYGIRDEWHYMPGTWAYFTTDPTDKSAKVYSIARPGTGGESSRFGDNAYIAALLEDQARYLIQHDDNARAMASYYAAHEQPEKAAAEHEKARRFNKSAQEHRAAAARIRSQWTR